MIRQYRVTAISAVKDALNEFKALLNTGRTDFNQTIDLLGIHNNEEITIMQATFMIGPIPANLEGLVRISYGIDVSAVLRVDAGNLIDAILLPEDAPSESNEFVYMGINGAPFAATSVALFVGVGFDIGILAAKAGVEGAVQLAKVSLPITGGAGININTEPDNSPSGARRGLPADISDLVSPNIALIPRHKVNFNLTGTYSGSIEIKNVLSGSISAKVKISFFFFSKTWRKVLIRITGFDIGSFKLFDGHGSMDVPLPLPWATIQLPMPFMDIPEIDNSAFRPGLAVRQDVSRDRVGRFFYDGLCYSPLQ
jgi:hypothetical protein